MKLRSGTHYKVGEVNRPARLSKKFKNTLIFFAVLPVFVYLVSGIVTNLNKPQAHSSKAPEKVSIKPQISSAPQSKKYESDLNNILSNLGNTNSNFNKNNIDFFSGSNSSLYKSYLSDSDSFCSYGCTVYDRSGNNITITCYSSLNSCTTNDSLGNSASTHCYSYINSCNTTASNGDSYNTHCYSYINSCSTTGSDGYSSSTHCYSYINSCNTSDSYGNSYNTHCYSYINSCSTTGSDGSYSSTHCYSYINSCTTNNY